MSNVDADIIQHFADEVSDILTDWERYCLDLESGYSKDSCEALSRVAHNLKGTAHALGLLDFSNFVHKIEDLLESIGNKEIPIAPKMIQLLFDSQTVMLEWLRTLTENPGFVPTEMTEPILNLLAEILEEYRNKEGSAEPAQTVNETDAAAEAETDKGSPSQPTEQNDDTEPTPAPQQPEITNESNINRQNTQSPQTDSQSNEEESHSPEKVSDSSAVDPELTMGTSDKPEKNEAEKKADHTTVPTNNEESKESVATTGEEKSNTQKVIKIQQRA